MDLDLTRSRSRRRSTLLTAVALSLGVAGCSDDSADGFGSTPDTTTASTTTVVQTPARSDTPDHVADSAEETPELTANDVAGLLWMREEEQLAHDVYTVLGDEWGLRIFRNIADAERRHVERVVGLLDEFGIDDPMADQPSGTFTIPEVQQFYDTLVADGRTSLVAALEVGALIEETDIVDLRSRATDVEAIQTAYDELEQGSQNHLRAFVSQLEARDVGYQPTLLDPGDYAHIVAR